MGSQNTDDVTRRRYKKRMQEWGMSKKDIRDCEQQIYYRQILKNRGELDKGAPLCTLPAYVIAAARNVSRIEELKQAGAQIVDGVLVGHNRSIARRGVILGKLKALGLPKSERTAIHERMIRQDSMRAMWGIVYFLMYQGV